MWIIGRALPTTRHMPLPPLAAAALFFVETSRLHCNLAKPSPEEVVYYLRKGWDLMNFTVASDFSAFRWNRDWLASLPRPSSFRSRPFAITRFVFPDNFGFVRRVRNWGRIAALIVHLVFAGETWLAIQRRYFGGEFRDALTLFIYKMERPC